MAAGEPTEESSSEPSVTPEESDLLEEAREIAADNPEEAVELLAPQIDSDSSPALDFTLATFYVRLEQSEKAATSFKEALEKEPDFHRARTYLARELFHQNRYQQAAEQVLFLIQNEPENRARNWRLLGHCRAAEQRHEAAELAFRHSLLHAPENREAALGLIESLARQDRLQDSKSLVQKQLRKNPLTKQLWAVMLDAALADDNYLRGLTILECMSRLGIADRQQKLLLGKLYLQERMPDDAVRIYQETLTATDDIPADDILQAIESLIQNDDLEEAEELLQGLDETDTELGRQEEFDRQRISAQLAFTKEDYEKARRDYLDLLQERPLNGEFLMRIGECYRRENNLPKARKFFERAARRDDYKARALMRAGMVAAEQEEYQEAIELLQASLAEEADPEVERYLHQLRRIRDSSAD